MRIIDVHNHFYPLQWIEYLKEKSEAVMVKEEEKKTLFYFKGARLATIEQKGH